MDRAYSSATPQYKFLAVEVDFWIFHEFLKIARHGHVNLHKNIEKLLLKKFLKNSKIAPADWNISGWLVFGQIAEIYVMGIFYGIFLYESEKISKIENKRSYRWILFTVHHLNDVSKIALHPFCFSFLW